MSKRDALLEKLLRKPPPKNFTKKELDALMSKCNCEKFSGGRGSSIGYYNQATGRIIQFDEPHPGNELYGYQIRKIIQYLKEIKEIK